VIKLIHNLMVWSKEAMHSGQLMIIITIVILQQSVYSNVIAENKYMNLKL
jgi:hypothetical protein